MILVDWNPGEADPVLTREFQKFKSANLMATVQGAIVECIIYSLLLFGLP